ncbi:cation channel family protein [Stylonychia lemnae]|uniref:Cation channel family protein n=1 Tax=Stylonychia lemnae TaxID=5949 RepID=A0A078BBI6_STYLE|nr:cation channel family protein [Stylonychia lemnae]|eukprot:CDW91576.1 cation channel family protein [Stylonychia lemnae]
MSSKSNQFNDPFKVVFNQKQKQAAIKKSQSLKIQKSIAKIEIDYDDLIAFDSTSKLESRGFFTKVSCCFKCCKRENLYRVEEEDDYLEPKGAAVILRTFEGLRTKIQLFGRQLLVNNKKKQDEAILIEKSYEQSSGAFLVFEYLVDILFFIDILVNFDSALELPDGTIDPRLKSISLAYIKSWFILDLCATFPTQFLESSGDSSSSTTTTGDPSTGTTQVATQKQSSSNYNKLLRLARLPRLYRLLRILRLFKIVKILRYNQTLQRIFDKIKMNAAVSRMIFTLVFAFFSVHLISCFWFLAAKFDDTNPETWVSRLKLIDEEPSTLYLECLYWSLQTVATVGFGDFGARTVSELFLCIVWMIFGVGFYSFVIGNLTSIIANENANSENLYNKLKALEEFAKKTNLPEELHFKIRQFLENNYNELFSRIDENQLLQELPITLRDEVFIHKYQGLLDAIDFLRECENNEFVWAMVQMLRKIKVDKDDEVYQEGDFAEEIYYIKSGKIRLYAENGFPFASYQEGQHFGDPEVLFKETRDGKAVAQTDCLFYALHKDDLEKLIDQHDDMKKIIYEQALKKKEAHQKGKEAASKVQPVYGQMNKGSNFLKEAMKQKFVTFINRQITNRACKVGNQKWKIVLWMTSMIEKKNLILRQISLVWIKLPMNKIPKLEVKLKFVQLIIEKGSNPIRPSSDGNGQRPQMLEQKVEDYKSSIPELTDNDRKKLQRSNSKKKSQDFLFKKKQRLNNVLSNVDSAPDFTKNVSSLLQSQTQVLTQNNNSHRLENNLMQNNDQRNFTDNFEENFMRQRQVEELKKAFKNKNKVSTMESYEKKKNDNFSVFNNPNINVPTIQEIIEQDETLGDADAEQGLENLARFNEDMSMIALNVYQVFNLFDLIGKENEEIVSWMQSLEKQTIIAEERQSKVERKIDQLISGMSSKNTSTIYHQRNGNQSNGLEVLGVKSEMIAISSMQTQNHAIIPNQIRFERDAQKMNDVVQKEAQESNQIDQDKSDEWEDVETQTFVLDYTKINELSSKLKTQKDAHFSKKRNDYSEDDQLADVKFQLNDIFVGKSFSHQIQLPNGRISDENIEMQQVKKNQMLIPMISMKLDKNQKHFWYQGSFNPVVGTSLFLSIDTEQKQLKVEGSNQKFFLLERKHLGSQARIIKASTIDILNERLTKQSHLPNSGKAQKKLSKSKYDIMVNLDDDDERKRDKKKKWKQHSRISVQILDPQAKLNYRNSNAKIDNEEEKDDGHQEQIYIQSQNMIRSSMEDKQQNSLQISSSNSSKKVEFLNPNDKKQQ